jgi:hypothetical protein
MCFLHVVWLTGVQTERALKFWGGLRALVTPDAEMYDVIMNACARRCVSSAECHDRAEHAAVDRITWDGHSRYFRR